MIVAKHQRIRNDLKAKIANGIYMPGAALPSQNQLMTEYGVAQGTVRQALDRLQADGLVTSRRGKGTFVITKETDANQAPADSLGLVILGNVQNNWVVNDQLQRFQRAAAKLSYEFSVRVFDDSEEEAATLWASRHTGAVIWGAPRRVFVEGLLQRGLPVVVIGELLDGACPAGASWVRFDTDALVATAMQFMTGLGHRRLWFVNRGSSAYFKSLSRLFNHHAALMGIGASTKELILERPEDEPSLIEHLTAAPEKPTALLIEGDIRACRIIHVLQQSEWLVPQRIGVVALGAAEENRLGVSELFRVISPVDVCVVRAAEALAEMIDTGRIVRHTIAPRPAMGKTCGPIESGKDSNVGK